MHSMLRQMPNTGEKPNPLDLPRQVLYVESVATERCGSGREGPSLGCSDLCKCDWRVSGKAAWPHAHDPP
ncbi:hypothetical protein GCM10025734_42570 [Kitasatospora paranensis]